jgi:serine/threonine protein kinase
MPAPTTNDEFLDLVRKSGVVDEKRLTTHLDKLRAAGPLPAEPVRLATQMVREGVLTHFQAEQFLQGKWRRFTLGKYKVLERLGAGGMGSVYLCEHMLMRRRVAVKVLPAAKADDSSSLERFYREARAVAALDHPNIVRAYDIDQDGDLHFLVMEHVDGSSLQEIIKRAGPMDVIRAAHYVRQAALGLQHAHETAGLVHRDIKPGNILVDRNGIVKILDMGLARFFHDEDDQLTRKHDENVLGTADYLAPEQALDSHAVDIRADVYSLGATFYFCLTGRTPFAEGTVAQKLIWHQTRAPKPIRSFRPEVPEGIIGVIDRMMAKDVGQRYQTPQEVADSLVEWTQTPIPPPPDSEMPQFSLAAAKPELGVPSGTSRPASDASPSPSKKVWQVSGSAAMQSTAPIITSNTRTPGPVTPPSQPPSRPPSSPVSRPASPPPVSPPVSARSSAVRAPAPSPAPAPASAPARAPAQLKTPPPSPTANNGAIRATHPAPRQTAPAPAAPAAPVTEVQEEPDDEPFSAVNIQPSPIRHSRRKTAIAKEKNSLVLWLSLGAAALVVLPLLIWGAFLLLGSSGPSTAAPVKPREPIRVGPAMAGGLAAALKMAKPGDRIVLEVDIIESDLTVDEHKHGITIEPAPGKRIVWKCPANVKHKTAKLLTIYAPNVTLKDITLDGDNKTEALICLWSSCPGVKLENLQLRNTRDYDILFANCAGPEDNPVRLRDVRFDTAPTAKSAVRFVVYDTHKTIRQNRFISLQNCAFAGAAKKLTGAKDAFDAATIDLPTDLKNEGIATVP